MATTASGVTIPGTDPTTTPATPIQDLWNNLGNSLSGRIIVPTATVTTRAALVVALAAEGFVPSASKPLYTHRADAPAGQRLEVTENGTTWAAITTASVMTGRTDFSNLLVGVDGAITATITIPAVAYASVVTVVAAGTFGNSAGARLGAWDFDTVNVTAAKENPLQKQSCTTGTYARPGNTMLLTVPAGTAPTFRLVFRSDGTAYQTGGVVWTRSPA